MQSMVNLSNAYGMETIICHYAQNDGYHELYYLCNVCVSSHISAKLACNITRVCQVKGWGSTTKAFIGGVLTTWTSFCFSVML